MQKLNEASFFGFVFSFSLNLYDFKCLFKPVAVLMEEYCCCCFFAMCVCCEFVLFCFVLFFPFFLGYFGNLDLIDFKSLEQRTTSMHSSETAIESKLLLSTTTIFPKPKMVKRL